MPESYYIKEQTNKPPRWHLLAILALGFLLALTIAATIVLAFVLSKSEGNKKGTTVNTFPNEKDVCLTNECISLASMIIRNMNQSVDPCDDFYQFTCGGWKEQAVLQRDRISISTFSVMQDNALLKLKKLLESDLKSTERDYIKKTKSYYASCLNQVNDTRGYNPLVQLISADFGGWPLADDQWNETAFDAEVMVAKASSHFVSTVCTFSTTVDYMKANVLKLDQPQFILGERQAAFNLEQLESYRKILLEMAAVFGVNNDTSTESQIESVLRFEQNLSMSAAVPPYGVNNVFSIKQMQERYLSTAFDWKKFFVVVTSSPSVGIQNLTDSEVVYRGPKDYFLNLKNLLMQTPKRVLANFIIWRVILAYKRILDFTNRSPNRPRVLTALPDNEMLCLESVAIFENMKYATNAIYVKSALDNVDKLKIAEIIQNVQDSFNETIDQSLWLNESERQIFKEKTGSMTFRVSYWEHIYNDSVLDSYYFNMTFNPYTYFENVVMLNKESFNVMVRQLRIPLNPTNQWTFLPIIVNALNNIYTNTNEFAEAIFRTPIYSKDFPNSINYGGIGTIIGHEISHSFDPLGIYISKDGTEGFSWSQNFTDQYNSRIQCLIDQYNQYFLKDAKMNINGTYTRYENFADNSGILFSFNAYKDLSKSTTSPEVVLPGISYTSHQLLYISYAQTHCALIKKGKEREDTEQNPYYSPEEYRVIGPLQNSVDFAETFKCPVNSFMNPLKKCSLY